MCSPLSGQVRAFAVHPCLYPLRPASGRCSIDVAHRRAVRDVSDRAVEGQ